MISQNSFFFLVVSVVSLSDLIAQAPPSPYTNSHYYEWVPASGITWQAAHAAADSRFYAGVRGHLATIASSGENAFLASLAPQAGFSGAWIAATSDVAGVWSWQAGPEANQIFSNGATPVGGAYTNWVGIEPNNNPGFAYVQLGSSGPYPFGGWLDDGDGVPGGGDPVLGYFVEYELAPSPPVQSGSSAYQFVWAPHLSWQGASIQSSGMTHNGQFGHLVTITSAAENSLVASLAVNSGLVPNQVLGAWLGAQVSGSSAGTWAAGPEVGQVFSQGANPVNGMYANWGGSEPNNPGGYVWMSVGQSGAPPFQAGSWLDDDDGQPAPTDPVAGFFVEYEAVPCGLQWTPGDGVPGVGGVVYATTLWDPDGAGPLGMHLVVGGSFSFAGAARANHIAMRDLSSGSWSSLGTGMVGQGVYALATLPSGHLVAGGEFSMAGGVSANHVAMWDGTVWSSLGTGVSPTIGGAGVPVTSLVTLPNGGLLAGGDFYVAGGISANNVAMWDGQSWSPLGAGTNWSVSCSAVLSNGNIVVGGSFGLAGGQPASRIALWNGLSWSAMGTGMNDSVASLMALPNGQVVAGGRFTVAGGQPASRIAVWNGASWSALGQGVNSYVTALALLPNGGIVAGGGFGSAGGVPASTVALWNGSSWSALGSGITSGTGTNPPSVNDLAVLANGDVIVGGDFSMAGSVTAYRLARWDGASWSALAVGMDATVTALAAFPNGDVVAGGDFTIAGGSYVNRIALWNGANWSSLGAGTNGRVYAVTTLPNGDIVAGGNFTMAGGSSASYIARWNGANWSPLGTGMNGYVEALATLPNGDVVAGGGFTTAGGASAIYVARWNGAIWSPLGSGMNGLVRCLTTLGSGQIVAGGDFTAAGGAPANRIAQWNGIGWSPLGSGMNGSVVRLATLPNGNVAAGGYFTAAGVSAASRIASWDGTNWSALGTGINLGLGGQFNALAALPNGDLVVGGAFATAGGVPIRAAARWNGMSWAELSGGANAPVAALAALPDGGVVAGGSFTMVGGLVSAFFARMTTNCPATAAPYGAGCSGSAGPLALVPTQLPWIGGSYRANASGFAAGSLAFDLLGWTAAATPLSLLHPTGGPGCSLLVNPIITNLLIPLSGSASVQLSIPNSASFVGVLLHSQVVQIELDPMLNLLGITSTNGIALTIGSL